MFAEINSLSEHNLVAPYKLTCAAALSVDNAITFLTFCFKQTSTKLFAPIIFVFINSKHDEKIIFLNSTKALFIYNIKSNLFEIENEKLNFKLIFYLDNYNILFLSQNHEIGIYNLILKKITSNIFLSCKFFLSRDQLELIDHSQSSLMYQNKQFLNHN